MGYKYQNKLDQENEENYWSNKPHWLRKLCWITQVIFIFVFIIGTLAGTFMLITRESVHLTEFVAIKINQ